MFLPLFQEKFVLWSVGSNQKLMEVACGGGHRAWDFALQEERGIMGYIKNKHVILAKAAIATSQVILKVCLVESPVAIATREGHHRIHLK